MAKTHTIEIILSDLNVIGELSFNGGGEPSISIPGIDTTLSQYKAIYDLCMCAAKLSKHYGPMTKLEINKK